MLLAWHQPPAPARGALPPCARRARAGADARADRRAPALPRHARGRIGGGDHAPRSRCRTHRHPARGDRQGPHRPRLQPARRAAARVNEPLMLPDLNRVIEQVCKEKGIDRKIIVDALKDAMVSAAKKTFGHDKKIEAEFNSELGEIELFEVKTVIDSVTNPENEIALVDALKVDPEAQIGDEQLQR